MHEGEKLLFGMLGIDPGVVEAERKESVSYLERGKAAGLFENTEEPVLNVLVKLGERVKKLEERQDESYRKGVRDGIEFMEDNW